MRLISTAHQPLQPPTAHSPACSSLIRLCVFVFLWIWAYTPLPPPLGFLSLSLPCINTLSSGCSFEQLSQALADRGACGLRGKAWREDVFDPKIYVLDSVSATPATRHPHRRCQAFPAMHPYSLASHCDKSYYTGEKVSPSLCWATHSTKQSRPTPLTHNHNRSGSLIRNWILINDLLSNSTKTVLTGVITYVDGGLWCHGRD